MKSKNVIWLGAALVLLILISACSQNTATAVTEEPEPEKIVANTEATSPGLHVGDAAPDFSLPDSEGNLVHLDDELQNNKSVILLFYLEHS